MDGYDHNLTTKLENSRNSLRRIARNNDTEFSKESVLNAMEKFVKTVTLMEETVLVPRRLVDLGRDAEGDAPFALYSLLNELKTDLLWAGCGADDVPAPRRPSRRTVLPSPSVSSCGDSDSEVASLADSDSGVEAEEAAEGPDGEAARAAAACRRHLRGLRRSLHRLTASASEVTRRYQDDVGGPA